MKTFALTDKEYGLVIVGLAMAIGTRPSLFLREALELVLRKMQGGEEAWPSIYNEPHVQALFTEAEPTV